MANTINMQLNLNSNIQNTTNDAKQLNTVLTQTQRLAGQAAIATANAAAPRAMAKAKESTDIGMSRGATGAGGGAEGKDFARQAQGLGGLVHVYATFAANLFAISAAFTALSKAADMTNMISGLDQLGAASGKNLGSMAKQVALLSDGALSLKAAMEATAQASAAGISGKQLTELTSIARSASQALGRDMADAMSRLVKGAAKIEPELLDELGLMVRVDIAAQNYARTLGKTVSSLTQFEKQQSFVIEMIKQGKEKFSEINIEANSWQKLLASITDTAYKAGAAVNYVLGPIARLFAESPAALATALGLIVTLLISKAIPALSQWREGLKESALRAQVLADHIHTMYSEFQVAEHLKPAENFDKIAESQSNLASKLILTNKLFDSQSKIAKAAEKGGVIYTEKDLNTISAAMKLHEKTLADAETESQKLIDTKRVKNIVALREAAAARLEEEKQTKVNLENIHAAITSHLAARNNAYEASEKALTDIDKKWSMVRLESWMRETKLKAAQRDAATRVAISNLGQDTQIMGLSSALAKFYETTKNGTPAIQELRDETGKVTREFQAGTKGMQGYALWSANVKGTIIGVSSSIMSLAATLSNVAMAFGVFIGAFQLLDSWLSKNSKNIQEYKISLTNMEDSVAGVNRTLDFLSKKDPLSRLSATSIQASANAMISLQDSLNKVSETFNKVMEDAVAGSALNWDSLIDQFKLGSAVLVQGITLNILGRPEWDLRAQLAPKIAEGINSAIRAAAGTSREKEISNLIQKTFDPKNFSPKAIKEALKSFIWFEDAGEQLEKFKDKLDKIITSQANAASKTTEYTDSIKALAKEYDNLIVSLQPTDHISKLGVAQIQNAQLLDLALKDNIESVITLQNVLSDPSTLKLMPISVIKEFEWAKSYIVSTTEMYSRQVQTVKYLEEAYSSAANAAQDLSNKGNNKAQIESPKQREAQRIANIVKEDLQMEKATLTELSNRMKDIRDVSVRWASEQFKDGINKLAIAINKPVVEAGISFARVVNSTLTGAAAVAAELDLKLKENALKAQPLLAQKESLLRGEKAISVQEQNTEAIKDLNLTLLAANTLAQGKKLESDPAYLSALNKNKITKDNLALETKIKTDFMARIGKSNEDPLKILEEIEKKAGPGATKSISALAIAMANLNAQLAVVGINAKTIKMQGVFDIAKGYLEDLKRENDLKKSNIDINIKEIDFAQQTLALYSPTLSIIKEKLIKDKESLTIKEQEFKLTIMEAEFKQADATRIGGDKGIQNRALQLRQEQERLRLLKNNTYLEEKQRIITNMVLEEKYNMERLSNAIAVQNAEREVWSIILTGIDDQIEAKNSLGKLTDKEYNQLKLESTLLGININYEQKKANIKLSALKSESDYRVRIALANTLVGDAKQAAIDAADTALQDSINLSDAEYKALQATNKQLKEKAKLTAEVSEAQKTWLPFANDIKQGLEDALMAGFEAGAGKGGKAFIDTLTASLKKAALKVTITALVNPITGQINKLAEGTFSSMTGAAGSMISGAAGSMLPSAFGFGASAAGGAGVGAFGQGVAMSTQGLTTFGTIAETAAAGEWSLAAGQLLPFVGVVIAGLAVLDNLLSSGGGSKVGGSASVKGGISSIGGGLWGMQTEHQGDVTFENILKNFNTSVSNTIRALGGTFDNLTAFSIGLSADPAGTANDYTFAKIVDSVGKVIYDHVNTDVARGAGSAELETELKRMTLATIDASKDIPRIFKDIISNITITTASSADLDATLQKLNDTMVIKKEFDALGWDLSKLTTKLIDTAGGAQNLSASMSGFYDTFYSEEEKKANTTKVLQESFSKLGKEMPTTALAFRNMVVDASKVTTDEGNILFTSLLGLSSAFASVTDMSAVATDAIITMKDLLKEKNDLEVQLLSAQGDMLGSALKQKTIDLKGVDLSSTSGKALETQYDYNQSLKETIKQSQKITDLTNTYNNSIVDLYTAQRNIDAATQAQIDLNTVGMTPTLKAQYTAEYNLVELRKSEIAATNKIKTLEESVNTDKVALLTAQQDKVGAFTEQMKIDTKDMTTALADTYIVQAKLSEARKEEIAAVTKIMSLKTQYASDEVALLTARGDKEGAFNTQMLLDTKDMTAELKAQYITQATLNQARKDEIAFLTKTKSLMDEYISLQVQLLTAQGNTDAATRAQRIIDIRDMDAVQTAMYDINAARKQEIVVLNERKGIQNSLDQLGRLEEKSRDTELRNRQAQLLTLNPYNRALQEQLNLMTDLKAQETERNALYDSFNQVALEEVVIRQRQIAEMDQYNQVIATQTDVIVKAKKNLADVNSLVAEVYGITGKELKHVREGFDLTNATIVSLLDTLDQLNAAKKNMDDTGTTLGKVFTGYQNAINEKFDADTKAQQLIVDNLGESINTVVKASDKLRNVVGLLRSAIEGMKAEGLSPSLTRQGAQADIRNMLISARLNGTLPDEKALKNALDVVAQPSMELFATFQEYMRDFSKTASDITELSAITDAQATAQDKQLTDAQKQLEILTETKDQALKDAQKIVDIAQNTWIGNKTLNELKTAADAHEEARVQFETLKKSADTLAAKAQLDETSAVKTQIITSTGLVTTAMSNAVAQAKIDAQAAADKVATQKSIDDTRLSSEAETRTQTLVTAINNSTWGLGLVELIRSLPTDISNLLKGLIPSSSTGGGASGGATAITSIPETRSTAINAAKPTVASWYAMNQDAYRTYNEHGMTLDPKAGEYWATRIIDAGLKTAAEEFATSVATVTGKPVRDISEFTDIKGFARGGIHEGGLRLVGGSGTELEDTGPSRIYNAEQTRKMFSNEELIKEIKELRKEVAALRNSSELTADYTKSTKDTLIRVTRDGNAMVTTV